MPTLLTCSLLWLQSTAAPPSATLKVFGAVAHPTRFSAAEIATAHNQAGKYAGISMRELLTRVGVPTGAELRGAELAKTVIVTGADGYKWRSRLRSSIPRSLSGPAYSPTRRTKPRCRRTRRRFRSSCPGR